MVENPVTLTKFVNTHYLKKKALEKNTRTIMFDNVYYFCKPLLKKKPSQTSTCQKDHNHSALVQDALKHHGACILVLCV